MFDQLIGSISQTFGDILPHEFCIECFLQGFGEGLIGGVLTVAALSLIAAVSAPVAIVLAVGLAVYGVATLASNWHQMDDRQKNRAIGGLFGGLVGGGVASGGMSVPMPALAATETGELAVVMAEVAVPAVQGQGAAAGVMGANVAMMSGGGGGGGGGDDRPPKKSPPSEEEAGIEPPARQPGEGVSDKVKHYKWGDPESRAYGHSKSRHGAGRPPKQFIDRARVKGDQGQWKDDQLIVEAEQRAPLEPGVHRVNMGRPVGRVYGPDGSVEENVTEVIVVREPDGTVRSSYPVRGTAK